MRILGNSVGCVRNGKHYEGRFRGTEIWVILSGVSDHFGCLFRESVSLRGRRAAGTGQASGELGRPPWSWGRAASWGQEATLLLTALALSPGLSPSRSSFSQLWGGLCLLCLDPRLFPHPRPKLLGLGPLGKPPLPRMLLSWPGPPGGPPDTS